jgi:hypothetical protein
LRRVRGAELVVLLARVALWLGRASLADVAGAWRCRPAQLRRCLLGRRVSARAAGRILAS